MKRLIVLGISFLCLTQTATGQDITSFGQHTEHSYVLESDSILLSQIASDSLFNSHQRINLLTIDKKNINRYHIEFAYQASGLKKTSQMAESKNALAAINGSFFDMDKGGSVSYFELNDAVINKTRPSGLKWSVPDSITNGALILSKNNILEIEIAKPEKFYESSDSEAFVMISGPILISNSVPQKLPDMNFANMRHPRTCVGISNESILFITIDGRSGQAEGMNLKEVQEYLLAKACTDAINLDGGGSTCMWIKGMGIVNSPSDKTGERAVANALLILKK